MWGGRFSKKTDPAVEKFTKSIHYDYKLAPYDIIGSLIQTTVLKDAGYLNAGEAGKLSAALESIGKSVENGSFRYDKNSEDIHTDIQNKLQGRVNGLALKLHTARSRNDQVIFSTRLYCLDAARKAGLKIEALIKAVSVLSCRGSNQKMILPGFTHMQHAQPVYLKDYLRAYIEMLSRDKARIDGIIAGLPLKMGAGALAGTPIRAEVYRKAILKVLKKYKCFPKAKVGSVTNSLDTVSDRDFVIESAGALAMLATHLSRLAEDLIIWSSREFGFVEIDEAFCTGSSLMPQKKNADVLEMVRGYAGRITGNLVSLLTMMKGLPLTYNRDMQLDKEPLFESFEILFMELEVLSGLMATLRFNKARIEAYLEDEGLYATDLVYYLVGKKIPFRKAHTIVGELVKYSGKTGEKIRELPESKLKEFCGLFKKEEVIKLFDPKKSVESKLSIKR